MVGNLGWEPFPWGRDSLLWERGSLGYKAVRDFWLGAKRGARCCSLATSVHQLDLCPSSSESISSPSLGFRCGFEAVYIGECCLHKVADVMSFQPHLSLSPPSAFVSLLSGPGWESRETSKCCAPPPSAPESQGTSALRGGGALAGGPQPACMLIPEHVKSDRIRFANHNTQSC